MSQEAAFTEYYGLQYQTTNMLLCILLSVIWIIRGYHYYFHAHPAVGACLMVVVSVALILQVYQVWCIVRRPGRSRGEAWRGYMFVADLAACTVAVVLATDSRSVPLTSSGIVHAVHGWFTPFAGFRLSAAFFLHSVNFQCYVIMKMCEGLSGYSWSFRHLVQEVLSLLALNSAVPLLLNIGYEARQRSRFSQKDGAESMKPVWAWIMSLQETGCRRP